MIPCILGGIFGLLESWKLHTSHKAQAIYVVFQTRHLSQIWSSWENCIFKFLIKLSKNTINNVHTTLHCDAFLNHCCHGNATLHSAFIVADVDIAVNNIKMLLPCKCNSRFPFRICRSTTYCVLLLQIINIKHYEFVCILALVIPYANFILSTPYYSVTCCLSGCTIFVHSIS